MSLLPVPSSICYSHHLHFENGFGISVQRNPGTYGWEEGKFEIALLRNGHIAYTKTDFQDVIGHLTFEKVEAWAQKISEYPTDMKYYNSCWPHLNADEE